MPVDPLTSSAAFRLVYREGQRIMSGIVTLYARPNGLQATRVGISVGRKAGGAVRRNRLRRRVREAVRMEQHRVVGGFDVVLVPRESAATAPALALRAVVRDLLMQAGVARNLDEES